jgi:hypothetical protein
MRRKLTIAAAALTVAGLGAFAAIGIAGGGDRTPAAAKLANGYESPATDVHRVAQPSAATRMEAFPSARAKAKKVRLAFFETDPFPIADTQALGDALSCAGNRRVLGGYFGSDGTDVALTFSAPETNKRWFVGITDLSGITQQATQAFIGIVCAKGVK